MGVDPTLTYLGRDKMAVIFADDIFKHIFVNKSVRISIKIWLHIVPSGPIDTKQAMVWVMAYRLLGAQRGMAEFGDE